MTEITHKKELFLKRQGATFFLHESQLEELSYYLKTKAYIGKEETVSGVEKPGEGNMNYVLRINTTAQSFILKQSRPWVEKYPHIPAPIERVLVEAEFLRLVAHYPMLKNTSAVIKWVDEENFLLCTEDLGKGIDFTHLYQYKNSIEDDSLNKLGQYLTYLHQIPLEELAAFPANMNMRTLNHTHIFQLPFDRNNGFPLDDIQEGLWEIATPYHRDSTLKRIIRDLGEIYLSRGNHLIHGDFFPGSWLHTAHGPVVIDPEFSFVGPAEFDIGIWIAHMQLADQKHISWKELLATYKEAPTLEESMIAGFAGTEIMRRLIGIAQLPLKRSLAQKEELLALAEKWIKEGKLS